MTNKKLRVRAYENAMRWLADEKWYSCMCEALDFKTDDLPEFLAFAPSFSEIPTNQRRHFENRDYYFFPNNRAHLNERLTYLAFCIAMAKSK